MIDYKSVDGEALKKDPVAGSIVGNIQNMSKRHVLRTATILPLAMLVSYLLLIGYFKGQGGYSTIDLGTDDSADDAAAPAAEGEDDGDDAAAGVAEDDSGDEEDESEY